MSKLVTSIVPLFLNSLGCGAGLIFSVVGVFRNAWFQLSAITHRDNLHQGPAQFCSGDVLYLRVQISGGWTLRFLLGGLQSTCA